MKRHAVQVLLHRRGTDTLKVGFPDAALAGCQASPHLKDVPASALAQSCMVFTSPELHGRGLLARIARVAAADRAVKLRAEADDGRKCVLLLASGSAVGQLWSRVPTSKGEAFENQ